MASAVNILKNNKLRLTESRKAVIEFFLTKNSAVGQPELEKNLTDYDRVTLYRNLNTFLDKGIIHKALDDSGTTKYALCSSDCVTHQHYDEHVHFKCEKCNELRCIDSVSIPQVKLPEGYTLTESVFLVKGICNSCH